MKRIGWAGFVDGKPDFETVVDEYSPPTIETLDVYKSQAEARKRYEDVRAVYVEEKE